MPSRPPTHKPNTRRPPAPPSAFPAQAPDGMRPPPRRMYGHRWRIERAAFLQQFPLCQCPEHRGEDPTAIATEVDHIEPHRGDPLKFWNRDNWQALAKPCHSRKTMKETRNAP